MYQKGLVEKGVDTPSTPHKSNSQNLVRTSVGGCPVDLYFQKSKQIDVIVPVIVFTNVFIILKNIR
jgi:hypothetical protein